MRDIQLPKMPTRHKNDKAEARFRELVARLPKALQHNRDFGKAILQAADYQGPCLNDGHDLPTILAQVEGHEGWGGQHPLPTPEQREAINATLRDWGVRQFVFRDGAWQQPLVDWMRLAAVAAIVTAAATLATAAATIVTAGLVLLQYLS